MLDHCNAYAAQCCWEGAAGLRTTIIPSLGTGEALNLINQTRAHIVTLALHVLKNLKNGTKDVEVRSGAYIPLVGREAEDSDCNFFVLHLLLAEICPLDGPSHQRLNAVWKTVRLACGGVAASKDDGLHCAIQLWQCNLNAPSSNQQANKDLQHNGNIVFACTILRLNNRDHFPLHMPCSSWTNRLALLFLLMVPHPHVGYKAYGPSCYEFTCDCVHIGEPFSSNRLMKPQDASKLHVRWLQVQSVLLEQLTYILDRDKPKQVTILTGC